MLNLTIFWLVYKWQFGWACNWQQKRSFYQNMQACKRWIWDIQPHSITILDWQCGRRPCWSLFNKRISLTSFEFGTNMEAVPLSSNSQGIDCKWRMWTTITWIWLPEPETSQPADIAQSLPTLESVLKLASHLGNTGCIS
jgi:hypothetical protein